MNEHDLEAAYRRYFPVISAKCTRMLRDRAEAQDVAQETFTRLWAQRGAMRDGQAVVAWVYRTATRLAVDRMRRNDVTARLAPQEVQPTGDPAGHVEARQELAAVARSLRPEELEALILNRVDGLTHEEVATVLRVSDRTVRRLLKKADERMLSVARVPS